MATPWRRTACSRRGRTRRSWSTARATSGRSGTTTPEGFRRPRCSRARWRSSTRNRRSRPSPTTTSTDGIRRAFVMPLWQVALLLNLALTVGLGLGYAGWGRRTEALDREFDAARAQVERLERERQACAGGARARAQQWEGRGVVRAIYPQ